MEQIHLNYNENKCKEDNINNNLKDKPKNNKEEKLLKKLNKDNKTKNYKEKYNLIFSKKNNKNKKLINNKKISPIQIIIKIPLKIIKI